MPSSPAARIRRIRRPIRGKIRAWKDAEAELLLEGRAAPGDRIRVRTEGDELRLTVEHSEIA